MDTKSGDLEGLAQATEKGIVKEDSESTIEALSKPNPASVVEDVPDPDEDDLDDLDGLLLLRFPNIVLLTSELQIC